MIIQGKDLLLSVGESVDSLITICHSKTCSLNRERDTLLIINPSSEDEDYLPAAKRGTISADGVMDYSDPLNGITFLEWLEAGKTIFFSFTTSREGGLQISGSMLVVQWEETGDVSSDLTYSFSAKIKGKLNIKRLPIIQKVYLANSFGAQLPGCPNPYPVAVYWYDGALIGPAANADEVISIFNSYSAAHGGFYILQSSVDGGCNFIMAIEFNAPMKPTFVIAAQGIEFAISSNQPDNDVISPDQNNDNALTPIA